MNLSEFLDEGVHRWPGKTALIEGSASLSYADLGGRVSALARDLNALDLPPGSRVGLRYPNGIAYIALTFALWRIHAVVVPIPVEFTREETANLADTLHLDAILSAKDPGHAQPFLKHGFLTRLTPPAPALPDNTAFIRFTSGTTSARKGVVLRHETIRDRVLTANKGLAIGHEDTVMWCLPMSHHFLITIVLYLSQGATTVLAPFVVAPSYLEEAHRHQATVLYATPFQYSLLAAAPSGPELRTIRLAISTTCGLSREVADSFYQTHGLPIAQALGVIELGLVSVNTQDPRHRWNSVGRPLADHEVRIEHPDDNGRGEIQIRGPGFLDAYAAPWLPREEVLRDGWYQTGDMGRLDGDGFLFLLGRTTAVINLAGRKVFPEEIEEVLNRHPAVRESRVYGRAHPHLGEIVEADVVWDDGEPLLDSVRAHCREHLAAYKIPTTLRTVSALPRTPVTGKILRTAAVV